MSSCKNREYQRRYNRLAQWYHRGKITGEELRLARIALREKFGIKIGRPKKEETHAEGQL